MRAITFMPALVLGCIAPMSAHASEIGAQSSGSVTITVDIPPFAAALKAQSEGAVGLWTVTDSTSAFMIKLPDTVGGTGLQSAAIFHAAEVQFVVSVESASIGLVAARPESLNGMTRESFDLAAKIDATAPAKSGIDVVEKPVTFLVTGL